MHEGLFGLREGPWEWDPGPCDQLIRAPHIGLCWGLRCRRCLPQTSTLDRAPRLVAAVVGLLAELVQVYSFLSKPLLWKGSEGTLGAKGNPVFPFCGTSLSTRSVNPRARDWRDRWVHRVPRPHFAPLDRQQSPDELLLVDLKHLLRICDVLSIWEVPEDYTTNVLTGPSCRTFP